MKRGCHASFGTRGSQVQILPLRSNILKDLESRVPLSLSLPHLKRAVTSSRLFPDVPERLWPKNLDPSRIRYVGRSESERTEGRCMSDHTEISGPNPTDCLLRSGSAHARPP
jgi:hypothetical protein